MPEVSVHEKADSKSSTELSKDTSALEKEVLPVKGHEGGNAQQRGATSLVNRSTDWARLIVWGLVIILPIAFIGTTPSPLVICTTNAKSRPWYCDRYLRWEADYLSPSS